MAILEPSAVRAAIEAQITATLTGWRVSRWCAELFGADPRAELHLAFAVSVPRTEPNADVESDRGRRAAGVGALVTSRILIRWGHRIRADAQVSDYDAALDAESALLACVLATTHAGGLHLVYRDATRRIAGDGTLLIGELEIAALHRRALA